MNFHDKNPPEQNIFPLQSSSIRIHQSNPQQIQDNGIFDGTMNAFSEADLQFLISNNFVILDLENLQNNIANEKTSELPLEQSLSLSPQQTPELALQPVNSSNSLTKVNPTQSSPSSSSVITNVENIKLHSNDNNRKSKIKTNKNEIKTKSKKVKKSKKSLDHSKKNPECNVCHQNFDNIKTLKFHKSSVHILKKSFKCEQCSKEFNFEMNFIVHVASHQSNHLRCPLCYVEFQRQASFQGHLRNHLKNDNFNCDSCEEEFEYEEHLTEHKRSNHNKSDENDDRSDNILQEIIKKGKRSPSSSINKIRKFECTTCGMRFTKPAFLRRHQVSHANYKPYECFECNQRFTQKSSLERHRAIHTGEKRFKCPKCSVKFSQKSNLVLHIKRLHLTDSKDSTIKSERYPCKDCSCIFTKLNTLNRHRSRMHLSILTNNRNNSYNGSNNQSTDDVDEITIKNVMNELKSWQQLMKESTTISPPPPPPLSSSTFLSNQENSTQMSIAPSASSVELNVNRNAEILFSTQNTNENQEAHEAAEELNDDMLDTEDNDDGNKEKDKKIEYRLIKHKIIDGIKYYACLHCDKVSRRSNDMLRHIRVHTQKKDYKCDKCGRCFSLKFNLKMHMRIHEKEEFLTPSKLYHCYVCSEVFDSLRRLDLHIKSMHNDEKLFKCSICEKLFKDGNYLRIHTLQHLEKNRIQQIDKALLEPIFIGPSQFLSKNDDNAEDKNVQKEYQCVYCGLRFKKMYHLVQHEKTHSNTKSYTCSICEKKFSTSNNLATHRKLHYIVQKFKCHICDASFTKKGNLERHLYAVHTSLDEKYFKCRYCEKAFKLREQCRRHSIIHFRISNGKIINSGSAVKTTTEIVDDFSNEVHQQEIQYTEPSIQFDEQQIPNEMTNNEFVNSTNYDPVIQENNFRDEMISEDVLSNPFVVKNDNPIANCTVIQSNTSNLLNPLEYEKETYTVGLDRSQIINGTQNESLLMHEVVDRFDPSSLSEIPSTYQESTLQQENISNFLEFDNCINESENCTENITEQHSSSQLASVNENLQVSSSSKSTKSKLTKKSSKESPVTTNSNQSTRKIRCNCTVCGKGFQKPCDLVRHMRMHTNDKPFKCDICSMAFTLKKTLDNHMNTHNENRLYYDCNVCGKKYASNDVLKVHLRIHTGEKPYQCDYCSQCFRTSGHRIAHMKAHHKFNIKKKISSSLLSKRKT